MPLTHGCRRPPPDMPAPGIKATTLRLRDLHLARLSEPGILVYVCVWLVASVRARVRACVPAPVRACVRACVRVRVRACRFVWMCLCLRTHVHERLWGPLCVRACARVRLCVLGEGHSEGEMSARAPSTVVEEGALGER